MTLNDRALADAEVGLLRRDLNLLATVLQRMIDAGRLTTMDAKLDARKGQP